MPYTKSSIAETLSSLSVSIYLPSLLSAIARGGALVALPLYALDQGGGPALAAVVVGLRAAGTMVSNVPSSQLAALWNDKAVMLIGLAIMTAASLGLAGSSSAIFLCISSLLLGVGSGSWIIARLLHVTETVVLEQRGRAISVMAGIERAGSLIGPVLAGIRPSVIRICVCVRRNWWSTSCGFSALSLENLKDQSSHKQSSSHWRSSDCGPVSPSVPEKWIGDALFVLLEKRKNLLDPRLGIRNWPESR